MKLLLLLSLFLTLAGARIAAQSELPPVYDLTTDTVAAQVLDSSFWQRLEDKTGKWTFNEVSRPPLSGLFHIKGVKPDGVDTTGVHTIWHRYRFRNTMNRDAKISLTSPADYFDVYVIRPDSSVNHYRSGWLRKWEEKDGLKSVDYTGAVPLVIAPGEEITVYDRRNRKRDAILQITIRFLSTEKTIREQYINYVDDRVYYFSKTHLQEAFIIGMAVLAVLTSLFFYRAVKEKMYLYFALFTLFLGINRLYNIYSTYTQWYQQDLNRFTNYIGMAWILIPFFLVLFIRQFFDVKRKYPKWDKILLAAGILNLAIGLVQTVAYITDGEPAKWTFTVFAIVCFLLIPLSVIITSLLYIRHSNRSFRYIALGAIPLMLLYSIASFYEAETGPVKNTGLSGFLANNFRLIEMIALCWLILCFMRVLIMRFDKLRKENIQQALEKERLAKEREIERNELIAKQKNELEKEVAERTADLKKSLEELKATQTQLIQSEKMASLGELTAGIAHEIQNPLNFVNNFSEVSRELIEELKNQKAGLSGNEQEEILNDIDANLEKIHHHGKRADAIVKGMLQHSRSNSGQKEPTDINALCDEYLRLSYHGLRAKDKSFNARFETNFDTSIPAITIVPQDIGRVILNLVNNAFYSVSEKQKTAGEGYEPAVKVITRNRGDGIELQISDNGNGIPQKILDKVFQPFFTTKPTGQGTGLGLSLSYDIITKGHGGQLKAETKEGEYASFIIYLPYKS